ncbi:MAG: glycosyltransferase family 2 protein [Candidatus Omnitrophota bacterium]
MDISIIAPVFNEEANIPILHRSLRAVMDPLCKDYEIIVVNDGSTDKSLNILQNIQLADKRVRLINFDKNYGQTAALDAGLRSANGKYILTIDADLQCDSKDLIKVLENLKTYDFVISYRINRLSSDGLIKFLSTKIANYIRNKVLNEHFQDAGCFLRGFRRGCINELVLFMDSQVFLASFLHIKGFSCKEIEIKSCPRKHGVSKYNIRNRLVKSLIALMAVKWMKDNKIKYKISA